MSKGPRVYAGGNERGFGSRPATDGLGELRLAHVKVCHCHKLLYTGNATEPLA